MSFPRWPRSAAAQGATRAKSVPAVDAADIDIELADFQGMPRCYDSGAQSLPASYNVKKTSIPPSIKHCCEDPPGWIPCAENHMPLRERRSPCRCSLLFIVPLTFLQTACTPQGLTQRICCPPMCLCLQAWPAQPPASPRRSHTKRRWPESSPPEGHSPPAPSPSQAPTIVSFSREELIVFRTESPTSYRAPCTRPVLCSCRDSKITITSVQSRILLNTHRHKSRLQ